MIDEHMAVVHHGQSKDDIEQQHPGPTELYYKNKEKYNADTAQ